MLSVVCFHAFPTLLKGGFIGVDVFFVISGFLISTIIFDNLERDSFSFVEFYSRRIKRIFPALLLVLTACFAFGWFALLADEYKQLGKHIAAGAGFVSNFVFWNESGYFDNAAETKPLLHLWTLGIEEQFYIVWPLLLWAAWKRKFNLLTLTLIIASISFALNIKGLHANAIATFYSPQTRFWELLIGSILAYMTLYKSNVGAIKKQKLNAYLNAIIYVPTSKNANTLGNVQALLGAALIVTGLLVITKERHFPGNWALLPTLGAVLIISAGSKAWLNRVLLSNRVLVWFGLISFPLYLWHWPLLSFARIVESETPARNIRIAAVVISIVLAWLTYKFIEKPVRFGKFGNIKTLVLVALMIVVGSAGYSTNKHDILDSKSTKIEENITQLSWPEFLNHSSECISKFGSIYSQYCLITDISKAPEIILIGDSNANHLFNGLNNALDGKNILNIGRGACPPFLGVSARLIEGDMNCQEVVKPALELAASTNTVSTVILSMMGSGYVNGKRNFDGGLFDLYSLDDASQYEKSIVFESGMRKTLQFLTSSNKKVVFVVSTPRLNFNPAKCINRPLKLTRKDSNDLCRMNRQDFDRDAKLYRDLVLNVLKDYPNVKVFDTAKELCDENYCYAKKDEKMLYRDAVHLSLYGSDLIAQSLIKVIATK